MSKIERVVIRLGNDEGTIPKFKEIYDIVKKSSWNWDKFPTDARLDLINDMLKREIKRQLYVCIYPTKHSLSYLAMSEEDEALFGSNTYWIHGIKISSMYTFEKIAAEAMASPYLRISAEEAGAALKKASKRLMTLSADTSGFIEAYEKLTSSMRGIK